jgi:hypothetical protein
MAKWGIYNQLVIKNTLKKISYGIREEISKVIINLESDNESDSESNDDDSSDGDETEDYEWP